MLDFLRSQDSEMVELHCGQGSVLIPPSLHGRIFCQLGGELIHRLDENALRNPSSTEYNNLGGNSLWPAPEGGAFAFNYLPNSDKWYVQDGICRVPAKITPEGDRRVVVEKRIFLINRKGFHLDLTYRRAVWVPEVLSLLEGFELEGMCYFTEDVFDPLGDYSGEEILLAPWSLEQFPGADGIVAFGKFASDGDPLNCDFYGDPGDRIVRMPGHFVFHLGGQARHQIGIKVASHPELIAALDTRRSLLIVRKTTPQEGFYFNIADNDQTAGPFSAADLYSIFNGGELGFYELETIGAMRIKEGRLKSSVLPSQTLILKGRKPELLRYLSEREGLDLVESMVEGSW